jgi:hypothetical protein
MRNPRDPYAISNPGVVVRAPLIANAGMLWRMVLPAAAVFCLLYYWGLSTNQTASGWGIAILAVIGAIALAIEIALTIFDGPMARKIARVRI